MFFRHKQCFPCRSTPDGERVAVLLFRHKQFCMLQVPWWREFRCCRSVISCVFHVAGPVVVTEFRCCRSIISCVFHVAGPVVVRVPVLPFRHKLCVLCCRSPDGERIPRHGACRHILWWPQQRGTSVPSSSSHALCQTGYMHREPTRMGGGGMRWGAVFCCDIYTRLLIMFSDWEHLTLYSYKPFRLINDGSSEK